MADVQVPGPVTHRFILVRHLDDDMWSEIHAVAYLSKSGIPVIEHIKTIRHSRMLGKFFSAYPTASDELELVKMVEGVLK